MDLLLLLLYTGFCTAIFKIFKVPLNKWSIPTAILGGIIFIAVLMFTMNYSHPYGKYAKQAYISVPIIPAVSGIVTSVPVLEKSNEAQVEQGDILFTIDQTPYQAVVDQTKAKLAHAQKRLNHVTTLFKRDAASEYDVDNQVARVKQLEAQLSRANYDLQQTVVRAPGRGRITQLALRPGAMTTALPLRPAMVFVPDEHRNIYASFYQNSMVNLKAGHPAEVVLDAVPGKVFTGKVVTVLPVIAEAHVQMSGELVPSSILKKSDRVVATIELDDDLAHYQLPLGVAGKVVVYSDHDPMHVSTVRRILLRMAGWLNYLWPIK